MRNIRSLKVIPQILLLSVFALSSCGNQAIGEKCLEGIKTNLEEYKKDLTPSDQATTPSNWNPPKKVDAVKLQKLESIEGCNSTAKDTSGGQVQSNIAKLDSIKEKYSEIYSDLDGYVKIVSQTDEGQQTKLKAKLKSLGLKEPTEPNTISDHTIFAKYAKKEVDNLLLSINDPAITKPANPDEELKGKLSSIEKVNTEQEEKIKNITAEINALKTIANANALFNLLILTGILGSIGYFIFSKSQSNKSSSASEQKRKNRSSNLGATNPQSPTNQGSGGVSLGGKGKSSGRGMGSRTDSRSPRNSSSDFDEYPNENQNRYGADEGSVDYQYKPNKPYQSQDYSNPRDIGQQGFSDRESNPNAVSSGDSPRQTYSSLAKVNRGLTEISAIQFYQAKSYSVLEPFTEGYYSATSESVTRNRADWANPLDLIEFYDGLFWIVKAIERSLLFPNPRMRIEQTRIRGIEYFFETNFTDENYHSCTVDAPAYVELVSGKWVRIRKGRITFLY